MLDASRQRRPTPVSVPRPARLDLKRPARSSVMRSSRQVIRRSNSVAIRPDDHPAYERRLRPVPGQVEPLCQVVAEGVLFLKAAAVVHFDGVYHAEYMIA